MSGQFVIQGLDESLIFNVLFAANGYNAWIESEVDPTLEPLELKLAEVVKGLPEDHLMTGVVVDHQDKPVFGAKVYIDGATQGDRTWGGRVKNVDKASITNEKGEFLLTSRESFDQWSLAVDAAGFVSKSTDHLDTGHKMHKIQLDPGCTVMGIVKGKNGEPIPNLQVGICQTDRGEGFAGEYVIATDRNGRFAFISVVPSDEFTIYSKLANNDEMGMFEIESFDSTNSESIKDLGLFTVDSSDICTVKGSLILTDDRPLPERTRLLVSRKQAWDSQNVDVAEDGRFEITGLASDEDYSFNVRHKGYRLSPKHNMHQQTRSGQITIHVEGTVENLKIYLEPEPESRK